MVTRTATQASSRSTPLPDRLVRRRWRLLTDDEVEEAAGDRAILARLISARYGISLRRAKQQVTDVARVARIARAHGRRSTGKRMRRALERPAREILEEVAEGFRTLRHRFREVMFESGLPGKSGTEEPPPRVSGSTLSGGSTTEEPPPEKRPGYGKGRGNAARRGRGGA